MNVQGLLSALANKLSDSDVQKVLTALVDAAQRADQARSSTMMTGYNFTNVEATVIASYSSFPSGQPCVVCSQLQPQCDKNICNKCMCSTQTCGKCAVCYCLSKKPAETLPLPPAPVSNASSQTGFFSTGFSTGFFSSLFGSSTGAEETAPTGGIFVTSEGLPPIEEPTSPTLPAESTGEAFPGLTSESSEMPQPVGSTGEIPQPIGVGSTSEVPQPVVGSGTTGGGGR